MSTPAHDFNATVEDFSVEFNIIACTIVYPVRHIFEYIKICKPKVTPQYRAISPPIINEQS